MLTLQDERDIEKLVQRYATGIDQRDYKLFRTCWTDDAFYDQTQGPLKSGDEITEFMDKVHRDIGQTMHRLSNIVITEKPDGVHVLTYFDALLMKPDGTQMIQVHGYYQDLVVKTPDGWKIKKRKSNAIKFDGELAKKPS